MRLLLGEGRRLLDLAADDIAGDEDEHAEQEGHAPSPADEGLVRQRVAQRQKHCGRKDLSGLNALQREAGEIAAPAEGSVLEDHRTRAGNFARDSKSLDEAQRHQQDRRPDADLLIGRQETDRGGREAHEDEAYKQHVAPPVGIAEMTENEGADRPRDVADAVGRERGDDGDGRIAGREEDLRKDQRGGGGVNEEVIVFERRSDPAARRCDSALMPPQRLVKRRLRHWFPPFAVFWQPN